MTASPLPDRPEPRLVHLRLPEPDSETKNFVEADPEVYKLKDKLIQEHKAIAHLAGVPIKIIFRKKPSKSRGKAKLGNAQLLPEVDRLLHPYVFLITLDLNFWDENPEKQEPLLFHELCHCDIDEDGKFCMAHHDLEEFYAVVKAYGAWERDVSVFVEQLSLFSANE